MLVSFSCFYKVNRVALTSLAEEPGPGGQPKPTHPLSLDVSLIYYLAQLDLVRKSAVDWTSPTNTRTDTQSRQAVNSMVEVLNTPGNHKWTRKTPGCHSVHTVCIRRPSNNSQLSSRSTPETLPHAQAARGNVTNSTKPPLADSVNTNHAGGNNYPAYSTQIAA